MQVIRKILFPIAIIYDLVTTVRNLFYDEGVFKSKSYSLPLIAVGNLSVGGTGKSPMIEYLINLLHNEFKVATLSRGYRRKTKGFVLASNKSTTDSIGDEPMQFYSKFDNIAVAVDADRQNGIAELESRISPDLILLDDAFQHRKVTAGLYILLTKYDDLYVDDFILPTGNLRESKKGAKRATVIIVTKCPSNLTKQQQQEIINKLNPAAYQSVFFTKISYANQILGAHSGKLIALKNIDFTLVTGIANPAPLVTYLNELGLTFSHKTYKDHHNFTTKELDELAKEKLILTTEKDYMRLKNKLTNVCYLPIVTNFLDKKNEFDELVYSYIKKQED